MASINLGELLGLTQVRPTIHQASILNGLYRTGERQRQIDWYLKINSTGHLPHPFPDVNDTRHATRKGIQEKIETYLTSLIMEGGQLPEELTIPYLWIEEAKEQMIKQGFDPSTLEELAPNGNEPTNPASSGESPIDKLKETLHDAATTIAGKAEDVKEAVAEKVDQLRGSGETPAAPADKPDTQPKAALPNDRMTEDARTMIDIALPHLKSEVMSEVDRRFAGMREALYKRINGSHEVALMAVARLEEEVESLQERITTLEGERNDLTQIVQAASSTQSEAAEVVRQAREIQQQSLDLLSRMERQLQEIEGMATRPRPSMEATDDQPVVMLQPQQAEEPLPPRQVAYRRRTNRPKRTTPSPLGGLRSGVTPPASPPAEPNAPRITTIHVAEDVEELPELPERLALFMDEATRQNAEKGVPIAVWQHTDGVFNRNERTACVICGATRTGNEPLLEVTPAQFNENWKTHLGMSPEDLPVLDPKADPVNWPLPREKPGIVQEIVDAVDSIIREEPDPSTFHVFEPAKAGTTEEQIPPPPPYMPPSPPDRWDDEEVWVCARCEAMNHYLDSRCQVCDKPYRHGPDHLTKATREEIARANTTAKSHGFTPWQEPRTVDQPEEDNEMWVCVECKTVNDNDREFCQKCQCDRRLSQWKCPNCEHWNSMDSKLCGNCGSRKYSRYGEAQPQPPGGRSERQQTSREEPFFGLGSKPQGDDRPNREPFFRWGKPNR